MNRNRNRRIVMALTGCLALWLSILAAGIAEASDAGRSALGNKSEIGLRTGLGIASIGGADSDLFDDTRIGFFGGVFARVSLSRMFSFEMDIGYVMKGATAMVPSFEYTGEETGEVDETVKSTLALNRIEIAPVVVFSLPVEGKFQPSLLGGVSFAFEESSNVKLEGNYLIPEQDISEVMKNQSLGFVVGAELAYRLESVRIFADFRYSREFGDSHESDIIEWINQIMSVGVGVGFGI